MQSFQDLPRRRLRYWCYRFQNAAEGGAKVTGAPKGLQAHVEGLAGFTGWDGFARQWDLDHGPQIAIVRRQFTVQEEWHAKLRQVVPDLPGA